MRAGCVGEGGGGGGEDNSVPVCQGLTGDVYRELAWDV